MRRRGWLSPGMQHSQPSILRRILLGIVLLRLLLLPLPALLAARTAANDADLKDAR